MTVEDLDLDLDLYDRYPRLRAAKAKRHREARHRLTQEHVDYLMKRRMREWYKSLRTLRMYGTVRAD